MIREKILWFKKFLKSLLKIISNYLKCFSFLMKSFYMFHGYHFKLKFTLNIHVDKTQRPMLNVLIEFIIAIFNITFNGLFLNFIFINTKDKS